MAKWSLDETPKKVTEKVLVYPLNLISCTLPSVQGEYKLSSAAQVGNQVSAFS